MHDTVAKVRRHLRDESPVEDFGRLLSQRLENASLARALTAPLAQHAHLFYQEAHRWLRRAEQLASEGSKDTEALEDLLFAGRHIHEVCADLEGFLERAEDNLEEGEDITHRETAFEREVAPFSRLASTLPWRNYLGETLGFSDGAAAEGAQIEGDLLKVLYIERRLRDAQPKPADFYALMAEMHLDVRRHLRPMLASDSAYTQALKTAIG